MNAASPTDGRMEACCKIELFGWLRVVQQGRAITRFQTHKTGALLAYLAYHRHRSHHRSVLHEILWPEDTGAADRHKLRKALTSLRHQIEPPGVPPGTVILSDRSSVQLNPASVSTDVAEFEAALVAARGGNQNERVHQLEKAVELYRGELLPGYYEEWIVPERQRLAEAYLQILGELLGEWERAGNIPRAIDVARRAVSADPLREESHQELIRLLMAAGHAEAARRQHTVMERLLDEHLGVAPVSFSHTLFPPNEAVPARGAPDPRFQPAEGRGAPTVAMPCVCPPAMMGEPPPAGTVTFLLAELTGRAEAADLQRLSEWTDECLHWAGPSVSMGSGGLS